MQTLQSTCKDQSGTGTSAAETAADRLCGIRKELAQINDIRGLLVRQRQIQMQFIVNWMKWGWVCSFTVAKSLTKNDGWYICTGTLRRQWRCTTSSFSNEWSKDELCQGVDSHFQGRWWDQSGGTDILYWSRARPWYFGRRYCNASRCDESKEKNFAGGLLHGVKCCISCERRCSSAWLMTSIQTQSGRKSWNWHKLFHRTGARPCSWNVGAGRASSGRLEAINCSKTKGVKRRRNGTW